MENNKTGNNCDPENPDVTKTSDECREDTEGKASKASVWSRIAYFFEKKHPTYFLWLMATVIGIAVAVPVKQWMDGIEQKRIRAINKQQKQNEDYSWSETYTDHYPTHDGYEEGLADGLEAGRRDAENCIVYDDGYDDTNDFDGEDADEYREGYGDGYSQGYSEAEEEF